MGGREADRIMFRQGGMLLKAALPRRVVPCLLPKRRRPWRPCLCVRMKEYDDMLILQVFIGSVLILCCLLACTGVMTMHVLPTRRVRGSRLQGAGQARWGLECCPPLRMWAAADALRCIHFVAFVAATSEMHGGLHP